MVGLGRALTTLKLTLSQILFLMCRYSSDLVFSNFERRILHVLFVLLFLGWKRIALWLFPIKTHFFLRKSRVAAVVPLLENPAEHGMFRCQLLLLLIIMWLPVFFLYELFILWDILTQIYFKGNFVIILDLLLRRTSSQNIVQKHGYFG